MSSLLSSVPRGTFRLHAAQLRHASNSTTTTSSLTTTNPTTTTAQLSLFKPPSSIISPWRCITGAQEWQTSTYAYNPSASRSLPTASRATDKLLRDFATAIPTRGLPSTGSNSTARAAVAQRRKKWEKIYMSGTTVKDYGDRVVVSAVLFDAGEAELKELKRRLAEVKERKKAQRATGGAGARRRRRPLSPPGGPAGATRGPMMGRTTGWMGGAGAGGAGGYGRGPPTGRTMGGMGGAGAGGAAGYGRGPPMATGGGGVEMRRLPGFGPAPPQRSTEPSR
ncbi:hypothetical protein B0A55_07436 [Friedmanniomyces simplex]|uniref:Uncharacterized protein n=1 Tax=Friedmanniomyces simplex TaxID=329884 RepID=A0A4U0WWP0_9PEZI|nr:hypothetical protein B0A55_07436 [Friedmanniomyces simplex]